MSRVLFGCLLVCSLLAWGAASVAEPAAFATLPGLSKACADSLKRTNIHAVAVPEFADAASRGWGGEIGPTGRYLARQFATMLDDAGQLNFTVQFPFQLAQTFPGGLNTLDELTNPTALRLAFPGQEAVALGSLARDGQSLLVRVDLLRISDGKTIGTQRANLLLDADLLALLGANLQMTTGTDLYKVTAETVLSTASTSADHPNPLLDPACPFRMEVLVGEKAKSLYRQHQALFIPATVGESYAIRLTNNSNARVGVALFIDGLNVVRQQMGVPSQSPLIIIKPKNSVTIPGWLLDKDQCKAFLFTSRARSVAGKEGRFGQIGFITGAFFPEVPDTERRIWAPPKPEGGDEHKRGLLGTGEGETTGVTTHKVDDCVTSQYPAVILTLRYDDAVTVATYEKVNP